MFSWWCGRDDAHRSPRLSVNPNNRMAKEHLAERLNHMLPSYKRRSMPKAQYEVKCKEWNLILNAPATLQGWCLTVPFLIDTEPGIKPLQMHYTVLLSAERVGQGDNRFLFTPALDHVDHWFVESDLMWGRNRKEEVADLETNASLSTMTWTRAFRFRLGLQLLLFTANLSTQQCVCIMNVQGEGDTKQNCGTLLVKSWVFCGCVSWLNVSGMERAFRL